MNQVPNKIDSRLSQDFARFAKPQNALYPGLVAAVSSYSTNNLFWRSVLIYSLVSSLYAIAAGFNNIIDQKTDKINNRVDNVLLKNRLRRNDLAIFFIGFLLAIIILQFFLEQPSSGIISLIYLMLVFAYSSKKINLQSRGLVATFDLMLCYGSLPMLLGLYQGNLLLTKEMLLILAWQTLVLAPILLAKDYKDVVGDRHVRKLTPLIRLGQKKLMVVVWIFTAMVFLLMLVISEELGINTVYPVLFGTLYMVFIRYLHKNKGHISNLLKKTVLLALIFMVSTAIGLVD